MSDNIVQKIQHQLKEGGNATIAAGAKRFFREPLKTYGWRSADVSKLAKTNWREIKTAPKEQILNWCEQLWQSGYLEETGIATNWSYALRAQLTPNDWPVLVRWLNQYVTNWAACDVFCTSTVADFLTKYPQYLPELEKWAASTNRWLRRAAAVSMVVPARHGQLLDEALHMAELLLIDADDLVQKGYGWLLKEASRLHQETVWQFVMQHKSQMPRTALRYAIEKMPTELRHLAMTK